MLVLRERLLAVEESVRRGFEQPIGRFEDAEVAAVEHEFVRRRDVDPRGVERPHAEHARLVELRLEVVVVALDGVERVDLFLLGHRADRMSGARRPARGPLSAAGSRAVPRIGA